MIIDEQSGKELEFDKIKSLLAKYCKSGKAQFNAERISPFKTIIDLNNELEILKEIKLVHEDGSINFPHPSSEDIDHALKLLDINNGVLILDELIKVYKLCLGTKEIIDFAYKHRHRFTLVYKACEHIISVKQVLTIIENVITPKLIIRNDATKELAQIRNQLESNSKAINKNFIKALNSYKSQGLLADTEETYLENRRLLSVISASKKQVKGKIFGVSSKGNHTYIEPEENITLNKNQEKLRIEESNEIFKILKDITDELRSERRNLEAFQRLLIRFDLFNAKVLLANSYKGTIPKTSTIQKMYWRKAIHPLLYIKNTELNTPTIGQEFELEKTKRFLVISGPNAGGKSITLKTVGLLQIMFQSGLFVPVDELSEFCWFDQIFSDIGDNQSIDNQLSTYSYRLSRMKYFLQKTTPSTLLLLDEFGSGSDPELGGALAEVFYEKLYSKNGFAVINTHYTNIKILTASLPEAINACMLFDPEKLVPLYQLSVGQPGSSFTFEVAQLNGIQPDIIEEAKKKVSESKVKLDELAISLQSEKSKFSSYNDIQIKTSNKAATLSKEYSSKLEILYRKAEQQKRFFEQQEKYTNAGKKLFEFIQKFKKHKTNNALNDAILKFIAIERTKTKEQVNPVVFQTNIQLPKLPEPEIPILPIKKPIEDLEKTDYKTIKVGDRVKIPNNDKGGEVKEISGNKVMVQMGNFTIKTKLKELTLIK